MKAKSDGEELKSMEYEEIMANEFILKESDTQVLEDLYKEAHNCLTRINARKNSLISLMNDIEEESRRRKTTEFLTKVTDVLKNNKYVWLSDDSIIKVGNVRTNNATIVLDETIEITKDGIAKGCIPIYTYNYRAEDIRPATEAEYNDRREMVLAKIKEYEK